MSQYRNAVAACLLIMSCGCHSTVVTKSWDTGQVPKGVPWVEAKEYSIYVYRRDATEGDPIGSMPLIYSGKHELADKVNNVVVDPSRNRWWTNYVGGTFADASLKMEFHENGSLSKAEVSTSSPGPDLANALKLAADTQKNIEDARLAALKREKDKLELLQALEKLQNPTPLAP